MSKTAQWVIDYCNQIINDDGARWGNSWLTFINTGQLLIADIFPAAVSITEPFLLDEGVDQVCPDNATRFLGLVNNLGDDGFTNGDIITICDVNSLSVFSPGWMAATPSSKVENYIFNENEPTNFKVYPPVAPDAIVYVGLQYAVAPKECTNNTSELGVPDRFAVALAEFCLHAALSSETDVRDPNKADRHLTTFFNLMGVKEANKGKYSPNVQATELKQ